MKIVFVDKYFTADIHVDGLIVLIIILDRVVLL